VKSIAATSTTAAFTWAAGRRTSDGRWSSTYDTMGRLATMVNGDRTIVYVYGPNDRIVQRTALHGGVPEDRPGILASDGLPAQTSWIWDPTTDRLTAVFESGKSLTATTPTTGLLRQFMHGDQAYDDPTEALVAASAGAAPRRLIPMRDEAATGNTQAVADGATGNLIERILYGDSYGDAPRYLQGPVVDRITYGATKSSNGTLTSVDVLIHLDEAVTPSSVPAGVVVRSIKTDLTPASANLGTGTVDALDPYTIKWTLTSADWAALNAATGAHALEVAVTSTLHADAWGTTSVQPAPTWLQTTSGATTATGFPVIQRQDLTSVTAFIATITSGPKTADPLYELTNLYTAAVTTSVTDLDIDFQGLPFREPTTGMVYVRNRWYDPATGTWLTPDSMGYLDSADLYTFAGADPLNHRDPTGLLDWGTAQMQLRLLQEAMSEAGPYSLPLSMASMSPAAARAILVQGGRLAVPVAVGVSGGVLANWTINRWADLTDLKADEYSAQQRAVDTKLMNDTRQRKAIEHGFTASEEEMASPYWQQLRQATPGSAEWVRLKNLQDKWLEEHRIGSRPPNLSSGFTREAAFKAAKRANGIPVSQQPLSTRTVRDRTNPGLTVVEYYFRVNGRNVIIRDDRNGHTYKKGGPEQNRGPHFNDPEGRHFDYER
jgi:RHS repeat-associated protein